MFTVFGLVRFEKKHAHPEETPYCDAAYRSERCYSLRLCVFLVSRVSCLGLKKALKKRDTLTFTPDTAPNVVSRFLSLSLSLSLSVGERECEREKRRRERERERERESVQQLGWVGE